MHLAIRYDCLRHRHREVVCPYLSDKYLSSIGTKAIGSKIERPKHRLGFSQRFIFDGPVRSHSHDDTAGAGKNAATNDSDQEEFAIWGEYQPDRRAESLVVKGDERRTFAIGGRLVDRIVVRCDREKFAGKRAALRPETCFDSCTGHTFVYLTGSGQWTKNAGCIVLLGVYPLNDVVRQRAFHFHFRLS